MDFKNYWAVLGLALTGYFLPSLIAVRYSADYTEQERAAIGEHIGIHAHDCLKPWEWRASTK